MSSVPAGKRSWKCPECGTDQLLSVAQLDPIACDACLAKMKGSGSSSSTPSVAEAVAGPLGMWSALPELTKLGIVVAALVIGLLIGYTAGKSSEPSPTAHRSSTHSSQASTSKETTKEPSSDEESASDDAADKRPEKPGPDYKWVNRRKRPDGTYSEGHWAKETHRKK